jgi:hypothetical protein
MGILRLFSSLTRAEAEARYQRVIQSHPTQGPNVAVERIDQALTHKIRRQDVDYRWGKKVRTAYRAQAKFMEPNSRNREESQRMLRLDPSATSYHGVTDFL